LSLFCCHYSSPIEGSNLALEFELGFGGCPIRVGVQAAQRSDLPNPFGTDVPLLDIISFNPNPFELVVEADTTEILGITNPCYPGRLRFIFTRA
jgi:hypothetical protein